MSQRSGDDGGSPAPRRLARGVRRALAAAESLIFPATCGGCGARGQWLCDACLTSLRPVRQPTCRCGRPAAHGFVPGVRQVCHACHDWPAGLRSMQAAYLFDGVLRSSIHRFKYRGERARGDYLGELLAAFAASAFSGPDGAFDLVVPVPLHRRRQRERGFNQAEVLARAVAARLNVPLSEELRRVVETRSQVGLDAEQRRVNVSDAFACAGSGMVNRSVLIVDDVVTTGATLEAAARAALRAGARGVDGLSLARQTSATGIAGQQ